MANPLEQYNAPKIGDSIKKLNSNEKERQEAMDRLAGHSFETEKGSIYRYDNHGRTSRYKTKTEEQHELQDITVFLEISDEESRRVLDAIHAENPDLKKKVYVIERLNSDESKIIRKFTDVENPRNLYLAIYNKEGGIVGSRKAVLTPTMGYTVFDTRHFKNGDGWETERHLGHKVTKID